MSATSAHLPKALTVDLRPDFRSQAGTATQSLPYAAAAAPRQQRFSPFKRSLRAAQPRPGSARAVLSGTTTSAAPGGAGTAQLFPLHEGGGGLVGGGPSGQQRSDVPMQRLLGGKARLRPQVCRKGPYTFPVLHPELREHVGILLWALQSISNASCRVCGGHFRANTTNQACMRAASL